MDGCTYRDGDGVPMGDIYAYLEQDKPFLTTPGSPHDYLEAYCEVAQWANAIVCLTISKKLSTMFDSACIAMEMAKEAIPKVPIQVLDCGSLAGAQGLITLIVAARAMAGDSINQVIASAETAIRSTNFFLLLKTVRYTARTGRLPKVLTNAGTLLSIKAVITITNGRVRMVSLHKSMEAGIQRLIKVTSEKVGQTQMTAIVMHSGYSKEVGQLVTQISDRLPFTKVWLGQFSPIMAYIAGPGALGIAFCPTNLLQTQRE